MGTESSLKKLLNSKSSIEKVYVFGWGYSNNSPQNKCAYENAVGISLNGAPCHKFNDILLVNDHDNLRSDGESPDMFEMSITPDTDKVCGWVNDDSVEAALGRDKPLKLFEYLLITVAHIFQLVKEKNEATSIEFIGIDFDGSDEVSYESQRLKMHKEIFEDLKKSVFQVVDDHSKNRNDSTIDSIVERNNHRLKELRRISKSRVVIVAEFTSNHFGNSEILIEMIKQSVAAGADAIKLQKRDVDSFYSKEKLLEPYKSQFGTTLRDYRMGVELNKQQLIMALKECDFYGIPLFFSILDRKSYEYLRFLSPYLIKLPSTISNHQLYFEYIKKHHKGGLVVSTGMTGRDYEQQILELENDHVYLLQCTSAYPTPPSEVNLNVIAHYTSLSHETSFDLIPGLSSHDPGSIGCQLSIGYGARMIEKHVKLKTEVWNHFDVVALSLDDRTFSNFCADIRLAEKYAGRKYKEITKSEHHKYEPQK